MKQGRPPGSKPDDKDVAKPADPAPGKKSLVEANTTAAPKPAQPATAIPTTAHATKKRSEADDWQPRWQQLRTYAKRRRDDDKDEEEEKDAEATEGKETEATTESATEDPASELATDQEVTETPD
jgi:hypothetical protein